MALCSRSSASASVKPVAVRDRGAVGDADHVVLEDDEAEAGERGRDAPA